MSYLKSGIALDPNENVVVELEAELWATSSNPIAKLIGSIRRFINLIFGFKRRGFLVITDRRVCEVIESKALWVFNLGKRVTYVLPSSVKEIGYMKEGTCCGCFCQSYQLYYESFTQTTSVLLSDVTTDADAHKIADAFYNAINKKN